MMCFNPPCHPVFYYSTHRLLAIQHGTKDTVSFGTFEPETVSTYSGNCRQPAVLFTVLGDVSNDHGKLPHTGLQTRQNLVPRPKVVRGLHA